MPEPVSLMSGVDNGSASDLPEADRVFVVRDEAQSHVLFVNGGTSGEAPLLPLADLRLPVPHMYSA